MQGVRIFCDVADLRSFSRAAELHGISQSAVSQRVHHLEERLGTKLLDRSKRPFVLTPAGEIVSREGRELVARYDALARSGQHLKAQRVVGENRAFDAGIIDDQRILGIALEVAH